MKRRSFLKTTLLGSVALGLGACHRKECSHILTLSFDDGFKKSFYKIAKIHEDFGLKACLNVIASAHLQEWEPPNEWHYPEPGNFDDWNVLKRRGHEIMPHTWAHQNLTELPFEEATRLITRCLDYFEAHLEGFKSSEAVYNFAYNASNPDLEQFALKRVRAVRTGGWEILGDQPANPFPCPEGPFRLGCWSYGPENADDWVDQQVNQFLDGPGGWLILNLHGLDEEGWGPIRSSYLADLLKSLVMIDFLQVLPAAEVLKQYTI